MPRFLSPLLSGNQAIENFFEKKKNISFIVIVLAYILCAMNLPVSIYTLAGHDDALFLSNAYNILKGEWLGSYSQMTLAKGPGYSLFLSLNAVFGIPITLSIALFYAFSVWLLTEKLIQLKLPRLIAILFFTLLLFHPQIFPTRIIRDNIYPALSLLVFSAFIDICLLNQRRRLMLALYGGATTLFWITREEGIWIIPALSLIVLYKVLTNWLSGNRYESFVFFKTILIFSFFISAPLLIICSINYWKYDGFLIVDFKESNFSKSLSLLNSIEVDTKISHVPVNKKQREIAYSISPAFSELRNYFEESDAAWTKPGCSIYPESCGDYAGGWFMWAYRDAVQQAGYYNNVEQTTDFYRRVTNEIDSACKTEKIKCNSGLLGFLPKLSHTELAAIPAGLIKSYNLLTLQDPIALDGGPSMDGDGRLNAMRLFLRNPLTVPSVEEDITRFNGWFYNPSSTNQWLTLECTNQAPANNGLIPRVASPDIATAMNNPSATTQRFNFNAAASNECKLIDANGYSINLDKIYESGPGAFAMGDATLFIDSALNITPKKLKKVAETIKYGLANFYKALLPIFFWLGLLTCMLSIIKCGITKKIPSALLLCAITAWGLVFTRTAILILIEISSFPAINSLYMGPAFPLLIAAIILSIFSFYFSITSPHSRNN